MGYLAVACDVPADVRIPTCHVNLWSLPLLFGRRSTVLDLGLALEVAQPLTSISIALPGTVMDERIDDLHDLMRNPKVAGLIFASEPTVNGAVIDWGHGPHRLAQLDLGACCPTQPHHRQFSAWNIGFTQPLSPNELHYTRFRIYLKPSRRLVDAGRCFAGRGRMTVDVRVADWREAWTVSDAAALTHRIVPIEHLDFFVIVPTTYARAEVSPEPKYIRLLEGTVWERYLRRATNFRRSQKLLIYRWSRDEVTPARPFRGFLRLTRVRRTVALLWLAAPAMTTVALFGAVFHERQRHWVSRTPGWFGDEVVALYKWLIAIGVFAIATLVLRLIPKVRRIMNATARRFRSLELFLYRATARL